MRTLRGCTADELEPGDEFSIDEGRTWMTVETICDEAVPPKSPNYTDHVLINARDDQWRRVGGLLADSLRLADNTHCLLDRHNKFKGEE